MSVTIIISYQYITSMFLYIVSIYYYYYIRKFSGIIQSCKQIFNIMMILAGSCVRKLFPRKLGCALLPQFKYTYTVCGNIFNQ